MAAADGKKGTEMSEVNQVIRGLHEMAMALAEEAILAKGGNTKEAHRLYRQAFFYEALAAHLVSEGEESEPLCPILYHSAAALALDCADAEVLEAIEGLHYKYRVERVDGKPVGFCCVLEPEKDPVARIALRAYAKATLDEQLRQDLLKVLEELEESNPTGA